MYARGRNYGPRARRLISTLDETRREKKIKKKPPHVDAVALNVVHWRRRNAKFLKRS